MTEKSRLLWNSDWTEKDDAVKKVNYEELEIDNHKVFLVKEQCWATPSTCVRSKNIKIQNKYGYIIYIKK